MTDEFKKSRDEASKKHPDFSEHGSIDFKVGADWAYEWCEKHILEEKYMSNLNALVKQKAIIEKLKEALEGEGYNSIRETLALMADGEGSNHEVYIAMANSALERLDVALADVKELEND